MRIRLTCLLAQVAFTFATIDSALAQCTLTALGRVAPPDQTVKNVLYEPLAALALPGGFLTSEIDRAPISLNAGPIARYVGGHWRVDPCQASIRPREYALYQSTPFVAGDGGVLRLVNDQWLTVGALPHEIRVDSLRTFREQLLISGKFDFHNDLGERIRFIALWDGLRWRPHPVPDDAVAEDPVILAVFNGALYVNLLASGSRWHKFNGETWKPFAGDSLVRGRLATLDMGSKLLIADELGGLVTFDGATFSTVSKPEHGPIHTLPFVSVGGKPVWEFAKQNSGGGISEAGLISYDGSAWTTLFSWNIPSLVEPLADLDGCPVVVAQSRIQVLRGGSLEPLRDPQLEPSPRVWSYDGRAVGMVRAEILGQYRVGLADPLGTTLLPGILNRPVSIASGDDELYIYVPDRRVTFSIDGVPRTRLVRWAGTGWDDVPDPPTSAAFDALLPEANSLTIAAGGLVYVLRDGAWNVTAQLPAAFPWAQTLVRDSDSLLSVLGARPPSIDRRIARIIGDTVQVIEDDTFVPQTPNGIVAGAYGRIYAAGSPSVRPTRELLAYWNGSAWSLIDDPQVRRYTSLLSFNDKLYATRSLESVHELVRIEADNSITVLHSAYAFEDLAAARDNILALTSLTLSPTMRSPAFFGCPCPGDFNLDSVVDDTDFTEFASQYNFFRCEAGPIQLNCPADLTGDGFVDDSDFVIFAQSYNAMTCP